MNDTTREVGGAIGIAVVGALISIGYRNGIDHATNILTGEAAEEATDSLGGLLDVAQDLDQTAGQTLIAAGRLHPTERQARHDRTSIPNQSSRKSSQ